MNLHIMWCVQIHPFVRENEECRPIVRETLKFLYDFQNSDLRHYDGKYSIARPRLPHQVNMQQFIKRAFPTIFNKHQHFEIK